MKTASLCATMIQGSEDCNDFVPVALSFPAFLKAGIGQIPPVYI